MKPGWKYLIVSVAACLAVLVFIVFAWQTSLIIIGAMALLYAIAVGLWTFSLIKGGGD